MVISLKARILEITIHNLSREEFNVILQKMIKNVNYDDFQRLLIVNYHEDDFGIEICYECHQAFSTFNRYGDVDSNFCNNCDKTFCCNCYDKYYYKYFNNNICPYC